MQEPNSTPALVGILSAALLAAACSKNGGDAQAPAPAEPAPAAELAPATEPAPAAEPAEPTEHEIATEEVTYQGGGATMKGYLAHPTGVEGKVPGVLVVHEWWGHNAYARSRAEQLAKLGYAALAVDMYGQGKQAEHPADAQKFMQEVTKNAEIGEQRFAAARDFFAQHEAVDGDALAAIGYCFGGAVVLHAARTGMDLDAVASFHGTLSAQGETFKKGEFDGKVLVLHGAADPFIPQQQVDAFKQELEAAGVDYEFHAYEGAKHAFTNPHATEMGQKFEMPLAYDAQADQASWNELRQMLEQLWPNH